MDYPVIVHAQNKGGYWVECPIFEGCYSQGKTIDQALKNIQEAIRLCLDEAPKSNLINARQNVSLHFIRA